MARLRLKSHEGTLVEVEVVLSRRNLLALLHKVDEPRSAKTLTNTDIEIDGQFIPHLRFVVKAEDDAAHYGARGPENPPGILHPDSEDFVRRNTPKP